MKFSRPGDLVIWFTTGIETLEGIPLMGGARGSEVGELPSTPKKVRFGITAKFIYPLSLQSTGPQLSVHPWKPTTTTGGEKGVEHSG